MWVPDRATRVKRRRSRASKPSGSHPQTELWCQRAKRSRAATPRGPPKGARTRRTLGLGVLVEQRDRQAMELGIRALRDDLVDDLVVRMTADPVGDELAKQLAFFRLRRRKHFHTGHINHTNFIHRSSL